MPFKPLDLRKPSFLLFIVAFVTVFVGSNYLFESSSRPMSYFLSIVWSLPLPVAFLGVLGAIKSRKYIGQLHTNSPPVVTDKLIVVVPTIGRFDTLSAIQRVVKTFCQCLPRYFSDIRVDVVIEEGCQAEAELLGLTKLYSCVRVVVVPRAYETQRGTRFKARANNYVHELRIADHEVTPDIWVLHMDDDTGIADDTVLSIARFITEQGVKNEPKHLGQGILTYPRQHAASYLPWLADALRPADDIGRFHAVTGSGNPIAGLHGELLLVRASVEAEIGWDFGKDAITEDAQFALIFSSMYPNRSGWFAGRCYGASPATVRDFIRQRRRWSAGLVGLSLNTELPIRKRLFLGYCMSTWVIGPLQHVFVILLAGLIIGDVSASPVFRVILVIWGFCMAHTLWMYWEGLKINTRSSGKERPRFQDGVVMISLIPLFSMWEAIGGTLGAIDHFRRRTSEFTVIAKPM